jgi:Ca2+-binding RTX toxin-like protein
MASRNDTKNSNSTPVVTPSVFLVGGDYVDEGGKLEFFIKLSAKSNSSTTVKYNIDGKDYTVIIPKGETSYKIEYKTFNDKVYEGADQIVNASIQSVSPNAALNNARSSAIGTVHDNDTPPQVSITVSPKAVGEDGDSVLTYTVKLDHASAYDTIITYTLDGTAKVGEDYTASETYTITIPAGKTATFFTIDPTSDNGTFEGTETVIATITGATTNGVDLIEAANENQDRRDIKGGSEDDHGDLVAVGKISDATDLPIVGISVDHNVDNDAVKEGGALTYTLTLSHPSSENTMVWLELSGSADGADYSAQGLVYDVASGLYAFTIEAGETSADFKLDIQKDDTIENVESITATVVSATTHGFELILQDHDDSRSRDDDDYSNYYSESSSDNDDHDSDENEGHNGNDSEGGEHHNSSVVSATGYLADTTNPTVLSVVANDLQITDADAGTGKLDIVVTFSGEMDTSVSPILSFDKSVTSTLSNPSGAWSQGNTVYSVTYDVSDANVETQGIQVDVTGAKDADGNDQLDYTAEAEFDIDTTNPTVLSVVANDLQITDADAGTGKLDIVVTFSGEMDTSVSPILSFDKSVTSTLSNPSGAWSQGNTVYSVTYDVSDANVETQGIQVDVSGAKDAVGNAQVDYTPEAEFDIDTTNPTVALTTYDASLKVDDIAKIAFTFSEVSTDLTIDDLTVLGGTVGEIVKKSTYVYETVFTPNENSTSPGSVSVASGKFTDTAGNTNNDGADINNSVTMTVDTIRPTIDISTVALSLKAGDTANIAFTLSEDSTTFIKGDIVVTGGTLSALAGSGKSYTAVFTPTRNSTLQGSVSVASGKFTDAAGNANNDGSDINNSVTMTINTKSIVPISLDLDGDNAITYLDQSAGVIYQSSNSSELLSTAWVGANDGLLAHRQLDGSLSIVFSTQDGETDLQGLSKIYDSNQDYVFDARDSEFTNFGVWQDMNSDAVVDAGEFSTLSEKGIVNLRLISNGIVSTAANEDVLIYGQTIYTKSDGSIGIAEDVAFVAAFLPDHVPAPSVDTVQSSISNILTDTIENLTPTGHNLDNVITGDAGNNTLTGGAEQDLLNAGEGNDVLIGGNGSDQFIFDTALNSLTNVDVIVDFASGIDKMQLDHNVFNTLNVGGLNLNDLLVSSSPTANSGEHIIYNTSTGTLSYDADGAEANAAIEFAIIGTSPVATILATDFIVV